jgi:predicted metal-dependent HD superfamily phosphohydrolase
MDHFADHEHEPVIKWCLNLDLLRLGTSASEFVQHGQDIREEYNHLDDLGWVKASAAFRIKAMAQPTIFQFPQFASFEAQARRNLANSLMQDWQTLGYLEPASSNGALPGLDLVMNQG